MRLEAQKTDIVITVNVPHVAGEYVPGSVDLEGEKLGKQLDAAVLYRDRILETFEIRDWGLFV